LELFSGKLRKIWAKILRTPKNLPAPTPMVCTTRQAQSHTYTASLSLVIHYTRRNAHTGDETSEKALSLTVYLGLKYRHIFKNGQQKKFSAKRPSKNCQ